MIKVRCPHCDQKLGMPDEYAGHRVRCSKCNQPFALPKIAPAAAPAIATLSKAAAGIASAVPSSADSEPLDNFEEIDVEQKIANVGLSQEDPREQAIRLARQQRAKDAVAGAHSAKKAAPSKISRAEKAGRISLADRVPEALRLPLALALSFACMFAVIAIWVVAARATSMALCFVALFVPIAAAGGLKLLTVNSSFLLAFLGTLIGGLGIGLGKASIAQYVVIPFQRDYVKTEVLTDMPALLADERYQGDQGESVRFVARDSDFMTCIALFSLVDDGQADPIKARKWAFDILRASNKTNIYAHLATILGSAPEAPQLPEISEEDQPMFDMAWQRMVEWEENETDLQQARKYFPALNCVAAQCETDRLLQKPDTAFKFAMIDTLGLFDCLWIFLGMGLAYISLSLD